MSNKKGLAWPTILLWTILGGTIVLFLIMNHFYKTELGQRGEHLRAPVVHQPKLSDLRRRRNAMPSWTIEKGKLNILGFSLLPAKIRLIEKMDRDQVGGMNSGTLIILSFSL